VAYGLDRDARRSSRVEEALTMVGLQGLADRPPGTLSGGQQQRVALARALAPQPSVLLLDEPFSNLDTSLRVEVRTEVHRLLAELGVTTIFVTHDQEEAFVLGDEVAVMRDGVIEQQAPPADLYAAPASPWVATFVGDANLVTGTADGAGAATPVGWVPVAGDPAGRRLDVLVRPEDLRVAPGDEAMVELVEFYGHDTVYDIRLGDGSSVRARVGAAPTLRRGDRVAVSYLGPPTVAWARAGEPARVPVSPSA
jgi:iron(III) transport system ATP-binding protein